jgi:hypothetical protein
MALFITRRAGESFSVYDRTGTRWARVRVVDGRGTFPEPELRCELDGYTMQSPRACAIYERGQDHWLRVTMMHAGSEPLLQVEAPRHLTINRDDGHPPALAAAA